MPYAYTRHGALEVIRRLSETGNRVYDAPTSVSFEELRELLDEAAFMLSSAIAAIDAVQGDDVTW